MRKGRIYLFAFVLAMIGMVGGCSAVNLNQPCKVRSDSEGKKTSEMGVIPMTTPPASAPYIYWDQYSSDTSTYPGTVSGTVSAGGDAWFVLAGTTGNTVCAQSLVITLGTLADSMMYLYLERTDPNTGAKTLTLIASDDDWGVGLASKIDFPYRDKREYPNSGKSGQYIRYLVRVTGYSASQSGTFSLTRYYYDCDAIKLSGVASDYNSGWDEVLPSWAGGTPISQRKSVWYWLSEGSHGQTWSIKTYLASPMTLSDSVLEIWDMVHYDVPTRIAYNDDYGGTLASQISMYFPTSSVSGYAYMIKVRAYSENQSGTFTLRVKSN